MPEADRIKAILLRDQEQFDTIGRCLKKVVPVIDDDGLADLLKALDRSGK